MKKIIISIASLVVLGGIIAAGWWLIARGTQPADPNSNSENNMAAPRTAQSAPDFSLKTLDGADIRLSNYRGSKPIILDFWASWSPDCRRAMPILQQLYDKYRDQLEVLAINQQEGENKVRDFVSEYGLNFPVALDPDAQVHHQYGNPYANTYVLIDKNGNIIKLIHADISEADILELLNS